MDASPAIGAPAPSATPRTPRRRRDATAGQAEPTWQPAHRSSVDTGFADGQRPSVGAAFYGDCVAALQTWAMREREEAPVSRRA